MRGLAFGRNTLNLRIETRRPNAPVSFSRWYMQVAKKKNSSAGQFRAAKM